LVVEGEEWQGFAIASDNNLAVIDELHTKDYALFKDVRDEVRIRLRPGDFTVYWPGELHRPNCFAVERKETELVKIVVKIHRDLL